MAILGAGNLALTLAGDLALRLHGEFEVVIWAPASNRRNFDEIRGLGTLKLIGPDYEGSFTPRLEDSLTTVTRNADFIVLAVPTLGQEGILRQLLKFDLRRCVLVALPGSATSLAAHRVLFPNLSPKAIIESTTSPFACRRNGVHVQMLGLKTTFEVATTTSLDSNIRQSFERLFPNPLEWYPDTASIFLSNTNPVAHPPGILAAREAIERGDHPLPKFYRVFVPQVIERVLAIDNERLAIAAALNLKSETDLKYSQKWYGGAASHSKEFYQTYEGYAEIETPTTMHHRYLTEDVKHILVLWFEIATVFGVNVPAMRSVVEEASNVLNEDLFKTGRTLTSLGLGGASRNAIVKALNGK